MHPFNESEFILSLFCLEYVMGHQVSFQFLCEEKKTVVMARFTDSHQPTDMWIEVNHLGQMLVFRCYMSLRNNQPDNWDV